MQWYIKVLKDYAVFNGRATRKEFWMFVLINMVISIILTALQTALDVGQLFTGLYSLAVLLPYLGVSVRRLHDIGKSGAFLFLYLIPVVGAIILLVFNCLDSQPQDNQYGPNPKKTASI